MTESSNEEERQPLKRYRVRLDGNRGEATMKLTEGDAERMGDRVIGESDSEQKTFGKPEEGRSTFADGTSGGASTAGSGTDSDATPDDEEGEPGAKSRVAANKAKTGRNK